MTGRLLEYWRKWFASLSVGGKLFLFCTCLLSLFLLLSIVLMSIAGYRFAADRGNENLVVGERVFLQLLGQQQATLRQAAQVLAADFGFREAMASNDAETIASALQSQTRRISATVAVALDTNGNVISSTNPKFVAEGTQIFSALAQRAAQDDAAGGIALMSGRPLELIIVPVRAPLTIGWVVLGFAVDDAAVRKVADLVALDISVMVQERGEWSLQASSLQSDRRVIEEFGRDILQADREKIRADMAGSSYQLRVMPLVTIDGAEVKAILQQSFASALAPYQRLMLLLLVVLLISFMVALAGSRRLALLFSRPLVLLTRKAETIAQGRYDQPLLVQSDDEIGKLARSVNAMSEAIAEREEKIMHQAYHDALTHLPNRQMLMMLGEKALMLAQRERRALAVLAMDIERFHAINETLGYEVGDRLIHMVGQRLGVLVRDADALARPGGNLFIALMHTPVALNIPDFHRRLEEAFSVPFEIDGNQVDVSLATGVALYPEHGRDINELMRKADIAVAFSKRGRHGIVVYEESMESNRTGHLTLLSELKRAVENDELAFYLQPKVNLMSGEITSAEALVRWHHPERGFVPPGEFIPFAEQSGRIGMLTRWMLEKAIVLTRQWVEQGQPILVSVNISARDVLDERFPDVLAELLERHQAYPGWIRLEITESGLMENAERALAVLEAIREMGFSLSIDDFGTGYSSLSYLKRMPVAELKIDRSFVQGARAGTDSAILLRSTIDLGHNLDLSVVAEGVETEEEWSLLRDLGCDYIQGYLASRPLSIENFLRWRHENSPFVPDRSLLTL